MKKKQTVVSLPAAFLIAILAVGGYVAMSAFVSNTGGFGISASFAKDGEDEGDDDGGSGSDSDDDEEKDDDSEKKSEKKDDKKKSSSKNRSQSEVRSTTSVRASVDDEVEDELRHSDDDDDDDSVGGSDDDGTADQGSGDAPGTPGSEDDDLDEDEDDDRRGNGTPEDNGMFRDRTKTMTKLQEELAKAERRIARAKAEGVDTTAAEAQLAAARARLNEVTVAFDAGNLDLAKALAKELKKSADFARDEALNDAKEVAKMQEKVQKRITQTTGKIAVLESLGGNVVQLKAQLSEQERLFAEAKTMIAAGGDGALTAQMGLEVIERAVKRIKNQVEAQIIALGGSDDDLDESVRESGDDLRDAIKDLVEVELGDDNGKLSNRLQQLAATQMTQSQEASQTVVSVQERSGVTKFLFGPKYGELSRLNEVIATGEANARAMEQIATQSEDLAVRDRLMEQSQFLKQEMEKLKAFATSEESSFSLFGWLFRLF